MVKWLACLCFLLPSVLRAEGVTVFAAASLKEALEAAAELFEGEVTLSFAGSSALARQIAAGAPADLFVSDNSAWMDDLAARGLIVPGTRRDLVGNRLVLVAPAGAEPVTLAEASRIAMALVGAVPAGIYGKAALEAEGHWPDIAPRVVQTDNVRAALALVALGEAPLGIVYASDAVAEPRVQVLRVFDPADHPPITYPAALLRGADAGSAAFLDHLGGEEVRAIFAAQGFALLAP